MSGIDRLRALEEVLAADDLELTVQPMHPDVGVVAFQASISKWPHDNHAIGRSPDLGRAVMFALRLWGNGQCGVRDEEDEANGGAGAAVAKRPNRLRDFGPSSRRRCP